MKSTHVLTLGFLLGAGLSACANGTEDLAPPLGTDLSLYALSEAVDGVYLYPPLGPTPVFSGTFEGSLLDDYRVVLEATSASGATRTVATFDRHTTPAVRIDVHEVYFLDVPAAAYFTDATSSYRFRVLLGDAELARSDLSGRVFEVLASYPSLQVGVHARLERRPAPVLASVSPATALAGSGDLALTLSGSGFTSDAIVHFGDTPLATTRVSTSELRATIPAARLVSAGRASITVTVPRPGGGTSAASSFEIQNPTPVVGAIAPARVGAGTASFTMTVTGSNFYDGASVVVAGGAMPTTFISSSVLRATVSAEAIATGGYRDVWVVNPPPASAASTPVSLTVENPAPIFTAITPASAIAGSGALELTLTGASFVSGAEVSFGATTLATTFVSSSELRVTVPSALLAAAGTPSVIVTSPAPSAGASAPRTFTVNNPAPSIVQLTPATAAAGSAAIVLTVSGTSFVPGATIAFAGRALTTTFVSPTRVTATVAQTSLATGGRFEVVVTNPAPAIGASPAATFDVTNPFPVLDGVLPASTIAAGTAVTITAMGSSFVQGSVVTFDGTSLATTFMSSTQLSAAVPAALQSVGGHVVTVVNAAPGGGTTTSRTFSVLAPIGTAPDTAAADCQAVLEAGNTTDGAYWIDPDGAGGRAPVLVWCDQTTDGGGWIVLHHDTQGAFRTARGVPSGSPGWSIDYTSASSQFPTMQVSDFHFRVEGANGWTKSFRDMVRFNQATRPTVADLVSGTHNSTWNCRSDTDGAYCSFTTLADGRSWGVWEYPSACCLGSSTGGLWYYSSVVSGTTENYGVCTGGVTLGSGYSGTASGCSGTGYYTPVANGTAVFRLAVKRARTGGAIGAVPDNPARSCAALRDAGMTTNGPAWIDPDGPGGQAAFRVYCDQTTDGGGWDVIHYDTYAEARRSHGVPSATPGWGVDYQSASSPLRVLTVNDFRIEVPGQWSQTFRDVWRFATIYRATPWDLFGGGHADGWGCNSDAPDSTNCDFTTGDDGRHWGEWEYTSGCCIGMSTGGYWYYSASASRGTQNWGLCGDGVTLASGYSTTTSGCSGASYYRSTVPRDSQLLRLMVRFAVPTTAPSGTLPTSCRALAAGSPSGRYWIDADGSGSGQPVEVYCDMTTDGGGWIVLHDDLMMNLRTGPRGTPGSVGGSTVNYLATTSSLRTFAITDFRVEANGRWSRTFSDVVRYGTTNRLTPPDLFSGTHNQTWACNTDNGSGGCWFTARGEGRHWGLWEYTSGCCIGNTTGGFWIYSQSTAARTALNYGACGDGTTLGTGYASGASGCSGTGYYTAVSPAGTQRVRILVR